METNSSDLIDGICWSGVTLATKVFY